MASYLDSTGQAVGLGAAARAADRAAVAVCADLVARWAGLLRSRRLLVADGDPDCAGAKAGIDTILRAAHDAPPDTPVYVYGAPVASAGQLARLAAAGVTITDDLDAVPDAAMVAFPAHGVPLPVRAEAAVRGLSVVDATCPLAALAHRDVRAYADRGDTVMLITGAAGMTADMAAERVSVSQAPESVLPVRDVAHVPGPRRPGIDPDQVSLVVQPGIGVDDVAPVISALRGRFPRIRGLHYNALCHAATDRAAAVRSVAASADLVLVLGAADDQDAAHMLAEATAAQTAPTQITAVQVNAAQATAAQVNAAGTAGVIRTVRRVAAASDIAAGWLAGVNAIGVVPARSAPPELMAQVLDALAGLGPLSVATREVRTSPGAPRSQDGAAFFRTGRPPVLR